MGGSSRVKRRDVKAHRLEGGSDRRIAQHFEGWQPGLLAILVAAGSALLVTPRPTVPIDLPEPVISPRSLADIAARDDALAARAEAEAARDQRLDFDVRALGSAIRAYGLADAAHDDAAVTATRQKVAEAAVRARALGDEPLLKMRAYQERAFLRALIHWEAKGIELADLRELGGAFISMADRNGWIEGGRLVMDDAVRRAMFKKRWNELTLSRAALDLPPDEKRALLRFLIARPPIDEAETTAAGGPRGRDDVDRITFATGQFRMRRIDELSAVDPAYPADLARGVVLFQTRRYAGAMELFRRHLEAHPDGPFTLRAQSYLRAALGRVSEEAR